MKLDREGLRILRPLIDAALAKLGTEHGINISVGNARFDQTGDSATFKLDLATIASDGHVVTQEELDFKALGAMYGFKPEDLGRTFQRFDRQEYVIIGLKRYATTMPILARRVGGMVFKFTAAEVLAHLKRQPMAANDHRETA